MKILLLADRMEMGGAETHIAELARGLHRAGYEVTILSEGGAITDTLANEGIGRRFASLSTQNPFRLLAAALSLRRLVREESFEILHAHTRKTALLLRFIKPSRAARIVTVHAQFRTSMWLKKLCFWGEHTVAVSEDLRAYVCDRYAVPAERVTVIPNGIDTSLFSPAVRYGAPRILFASRLDRDCALGAELLCEIAPSLVEQFPGTSIDLAGGGDAYGALQARADEVNRRLGRTVICTLGWVENMPALLRKYDIFVGVSRAAMEAAASGCAVILCGNEGYGGILSSQTAPAASLSNFCARGKEPPNAARLYADLSCLMESPALRRQYGDEGRRLIEAEYAAAEMCRHTLALYRRARPQKKSRTVTVGGYFGCGNLGDDAMLGGFLAGVEQVAPDLSVQALTRRPRRDRRRFGIVCRQRKSPFSIVSALLPSDAFVCGGGSLLQSTTSRRSLAYYLTLLRLSRLLCRRTLLWGAGIGPLEKRELLRTLRVLKKCDYVGLRDPDSLALLAREGIDPARLHQGADPAVLLPLPPPTRGAFLLSEIGVPPEGDRLAIVLHGSAPAPLTEALLSAVSVVCARHRLIPILPILDRRVDAARTREAARRLSGVAVEAREPSDVTAILSTCRAAVSLRLHAVVLSTCAGVPALGIAANPDDQKIAAFAKAAGQDHLSPTLSVPTLVGAISLLLDGRERRAPLLADATARMQALALEELKRMF